MTTAPGWYDDPYPHAPGAPRARRWWDGTQWTGHVDPGQTGPAYGGAPTTPDGVPLASWWSRVGAQLIDSLILLVIACLLGFPLLRDVMGQFGDYFEASLAAGRDGTPPPSSLDFQRGLAGTLLKFGVLSLVVGLAYTVGFLRWKQATPGKLALGLRVRLREHPGLPMPAVLKRWAVQYGIVGLLALVPVVGGLFSAFVYLDDLWPLWDEKKQALHDKAAATNVVRVR